jgi:hypothetical protein
VCAKCRERGDHALCVVGIEQRAAEFACAAGERGKQQCTIAQALAARRRDGDARAGCNCRWRWQHQPRRQLRDWQREVIKRIVRACVHEWLLAASHS